MSGQAKDIAHGIAAGGGRQASGPLKQIAHDAFISGLNELFLIAAIVAFAGALLGFVLVRQSDFVGHANQGAESAPAAA